METEDIIWLLLSLIPCWICRSDSEDNFAAGPSRIAYWATWITFGRCLSTIMLPSSAPVTQHYNQWRRHPTVKGEEKAHKKEQGHAMAVVLVPTLLNVMARYNTYWSRHAVCTSLIAALPVTLQVLSCFGMITTDKHIANGNTAYSTELLPLGFAANFLAYISMDYFLQGEVSAISKALTFGEFRVLVSLFTIFLWEWVSRMRTSIMNGSFISADDNNNPPHGIVALSGFLGCIITSKLVVSDRKRNISLAMRIVVQTLGPLVVVELSLFFASPLLSFPRSLRWLWHFLQATEDNHSNMGNDQFIYPRYWGLLYWAALFVLLALPTIQMARHSSRIDPVISRKWFHLVAVLLFGPITWIFPQLMSLSYAVALCGLIVLETLRDDFAILQSFYLGFLDPAKDQIVVENSATGKNTKTNCRGNGIILSHMCLILGCAAPLWVAELCVANNAQLNMLLSQWGVLCLGVGDAMGALVGKGFGKNLWGKNRRTYEGSLAMCVSMIAIGCWFLQNTYDCWWVLVVATTFVTVLEAFTLQMDNLVLPLAGSAVILLLHSCWLDIAYSSIVSP